MNRMMSGIMVSLVLAALPTIAFAFGNDDHWVSGWGMGVAEAVVTKGPGNQIYVTCDDGADRNATGISFTLAGDTSKDSSIQLIFDNEDPEDYSLWNGEIPTDCRVCAQIYDVVIDKLKKHSTVHVKFQDGLGTRFSLKGATKAIGECTADFYR